MTYLKATIGIFIALAASRFIPHPPNFTSLIALSFYIPVFFGIKFIPIIMLCFAITDYFIGFHSLTFFTWGSVMLVGLISKFFIENIVKRMSGAIIGALIFFIITNFGVWISGNMYEFSFNGFISCYVLALPFFGYTLISTFVFSTIIETLYKFKFLKEFINIKSFK